MVMSLMQMHLLLYIYKPVLIYPELFFKILMSLLSVSRILSSTLYKHVAVHLLVLCQAVSICEKKWERRVMKNICQRNRQNLLYLYVIHQTPWWKQLLLNRHNLFYNCCLPLFNNQNTKLNQMQLIFILDLETFFLTCSLSFFPLSTPASQYFSVAL